VSTEYDALLYQYRVIGAQVGATQAQSEVLLAETRAADMLELELATELDFGGISTSQASAACLSGGQGGSVTPELV